MGVGIDWDGAQGHFWSEWNVSYLDCHGGTMGIYICQKSLIHILNRCILLYVNFNLIKLFKIAFEIDVWLHCSSYREIKIDRRIIYDLILQMGERMNYFLFQGTLRILASRLLIWQRRKQSEMEFVHGPLRSNTSAKIRWTTFFLLMN